MFMHTENLIAIAVMIAGSLFWGGLRFSLMWIYNRIDERMNNMRTQVRREFELLETERSRIANDLHDDLGSLLSAVSVRINCLEATGEKDQQNLTIIRQYLDQVIERVGNISHNLIPQTLIRKGLDPALKDFFNQYQGITSTDLDYVYEVKSMIPHHKSLHLFRIVQEMVNNGLRHSKANLIQVCLFDKEQKLHLLYTDNGVGFDADGDRDSKGLGLSSLKNRTEILAGKMKMDARPGKGVEYYFEFPL